MNSAAIDMHPDPNKRQRNRHRERAMKRREIESEKMGKNELRRIYRPGESPEKDAWFTAFFIENHLDYFTYPEHASSPEQIRFMVCTEPEERYYPCSDRMFEAIMTRQQSAFLQKRYNESLHRVLDMIEEKIEEPWEKSYLESLIITKYQHETRDEIMIPSRLEKRLLSIFLKRTQIEDPYLEEKAARNRRARYHRDSGAFRAALNRVADEHLACPPETLSEMRRTASRVELRRLILAASRPELWTAEPSEDHPVDYGRLFQSSLEGNGAELLLSRLGLAGDEGGATPKAILWLVNESGEVIFDFAVVRCLVALGNQVVMAFKEGPLFTQCDFFDVQEDPVLVEELEGALLVSDPRLGKNELVKTLKSDFGVIALSDATRENLNLALVSTTFARVFREVDLVVSRGLDQRRRFFDTHFQFTQDVFNISTEADGSVTVWHKPRHPSAVKFSHGDLELKARSIIDRMKQARKNGMTVVFYSGIIGSIPGKIDIAKKIMSVFVEHLKEQYTQTFIINPSEYFEPGMDADDLMYMWEIVQRSGYIDIWRFQTYEDIVEAFQLMDRKVPPEWVGKDATFSTGCTKEMKIALEVQEQNPEMQIIGPAREKFMRRGEYGIGKMYDQRLKVV